MFEAAAGSLPGDSDKEPVEFLFPIDSRAEPLSLLLPVRRQRPLQLREHEHLISLLAKDRVDEVGRQQRQVTDSFFALNAFSKDSITYLK